MVLFEKIFIKLFTQTLASEGYECILRTECVPHLHEMRNTSGQSAYLLQDNASVHTSLHTKKVILETGIKTLNILPYSPDINTIGM